MRSQEFSHKRKRAKVIGAVVVGAEPKWHFSFADRFNGKAFWRFQGWGFLRKALENS